MRWIVFAFLLFNFVLHAEPVEFELEFTINYEPNEELVSSEFVDIDNDNIEELIVYYTNIDQQLLIANVYNSSGEFIYSKSFLYSADYDYGAISAKIIVESTEIYLVCCHEYNGYHISLYNFNSEVLLDELTYPTIYLRNSNIEYFIENNDLYCIVGVEYDVVFECLSKIHKLKIENNQLIDTMSLDNFGCEVLVLDQTDYFASVGHYGWGDEGYFSGSYKTSICDFVNLSPYIEFGVCGYNITPNSTGGVSQYILLQKNHQDTFDRILTYQRTTLNYQFNSQFFKCFDLQSGGLLWESESCEIGTAHISAYTSVKVNEETYYVMYFKGYGVEIRDVQNGEIIHSQTATIYPNEVISNNDQVLYFVENDNTNHHLNLYTLSEPINVSANHVLLTSETHLSNYPNPFNPSTEIKFQLKDIDEIESAKIEIFNIKGQKVRTLSPSLCHPEPFDKLRTGSVEGRGQNTQFSVNWNSVDSNNNPVSSGIYFYQLKVDGKVQKSKKMMLIK